MSAAPRDAERVRRARRVVLAEHGDVVAATLDCADAVAERLADPITDGRELASALERELADVDLLERYSTVLTDAVAAAELSLAAAPVAAPPYVVVTSRGPVLRAITDAGRLVVTIAVFTPRSTGTTQYVRDATDVPSAVAVAIR